MGFPSAVFLFRALYAITFSVFVTIQVPTFKVPTLKAIVHLLTSCLFSQYVLNKSEDEYEGEGENVSTLIVNFGQEMIKN